LATKQEFDRCWQVLVAAYPVWVKELGQAQLEQTFRVYQKILMVMPGPILEATVYHHVETSRWFPTVGELRTEAMRLLSAPRRTGLEAWGEVMDAMQSGGLRIMESGDGYYPPEWQDPITARIVQSMGWRNLCQSETMMADRAQFIHAYDAIAEREATESLMSPLVREVTRKLKAERPPQLED
jgi:hypothetical protein